MLPLHNLTYLFPLGAKEKHRWEPHKDILDGGTYYRFTGPPPAEDEVLAYIGNGGVFASTGYSAGGYVDRAVKEFVDSLGGLEHRVVGVNKRIAGPHGSGPGGRIRCGDDWIPSDALVICKRPTDRPVIDPRNTVYHVGVSGGKDSQTVLLWMVKDSGVRKQDIVATFADTKNEHEWTYTHLDLLRERVHPIIELEPDYGFDDLALKKRRFPSTKARFCTDWLKIRPSNKFLKEQAATGKTVIAVSGVRADESFERSTIKEWEWDGNALCWRWSPLIRWTWDDVVAYNQKHGLPLNPLYALGAQRVGCFPCIMSRKAEIRMIALKFPERIDQIRRLEQEFEARFGRYSSFFPAKTVPERFRSKPYQMPDGSWVKVATIDDVVKWSMTGNRAQGSYLDDEPEPEAKCNSGYCE
jgi:3'-phosphoadenosine 5'-phosphosulfate sulfotransferase (PAPS reductase)/FAD synthetase